MRKFDGEVDGRPCLLGISPESRRRSAGKQLRSLIDAYRSGSVDLPSLAARVGMLVEQLQAFLRVEDYSLAMNCVEVVEQINVVVLEERRPVDPSEKDAIEHQLSLIDDISSRRKRRAVLLRRALSS